MKREKAYKIIKAIKDIRSTLSDEVALNYSVLYPDWVVGKNLLAGDRVEYEDKLYKVLQDHTTQETWAPSVAPSLFAEVLIPDTNIIPNWIQPDSTNPYMINDKVSYNDQIWISVVDNNVWAPGAYGWEIVE
jgi:hypothetical protein